MDVMLVAHDREPTGDTQTLWSGAVITLRLGDDERLMAFLRAKLPDADVPEWKNADPLVQPDWAVPVLMAGVAHIAKVFLYMALPDARREVRPEQTRARQRIQTLGAKKRARAERRLGDVYDRIVVGPHTASAPCTVDTSDRTIAPHMRRGHFRSQHHGPGNTMLKLVYIAPTLVRADLVAGGANPEPRPYLVKGMATPQSPA